MKVGSTFVKFKFFWVLFSIYFILLIVFLPEYLLQAFKNFLDKYGPFTLIISILFILGLSIYIFELSQNERKVTKRYFAFFLRYVSALGLLGSLWALVSKSKDVFQTEGKINIQTLFMVMQEAWISTIVALICAVIVGMIILLDKKLDE